MGPVVPDEVANIAVKYNYTWTDRTFQQDILAFMRLIKNYHIKKEFRLKQGIVQMQVCFSSTLLIPILFVLYIIESDNRSKIA